MKDWEIYEKQIFDKLSTEFPQSKIEKNQKITGIFSKRKRQIDILVKTSAIGKDLIIAIDCKKFSKKINVKTVESFIGFLEDIGAHLGVLITNEGYTKSALRRVENYTKDIRLDIVEFQNLEDYHFSWDICEACKRVDKYREISFQEPQLIEFNGLYQLIQLGQCDYCGTDYIKCQGCGSIIELEDLEDVECYCGLSFTASHPYHDDPSYFEVSIKNADGVKKDNFVDPNQLRIFK